MDAQDDSLPGLLATDLDAHFEHLVLSYQHGLHAFALRHTGSPQLAEDIVQEAFMRAYSTLQNYPPYRIGTLKLRPWLYKITLNVFYGHLRSSRLQELPLDGTEGSPMLEAIDEDWLNQPELVIENKEWLGKLEAGVARLPLPFRELVNLYYFEELSYREITEVLNLPLGTVKSGIHRGTRLLRQALQTQESEVK
jgi:RNA polymerase sigma-70 factor (ECF subfamily)